MTNGARSLESMLWDAANILRGPVDASDFKAYVFPMLFLKRISDVYDEERAEALEESGGDEEYADLPEQHRFQIPDDSHWDDLRKRTTNVGQAIQRAMRQIEKANPNTLYGIFGDVQWSNKERLSDELLIDLIDHFSQLDLSNQAVPNDLLGDAYEYLIKKFADLTNRKAGEFYTPRTVVELMVRMLAPEAGDTVYDPACGTGGMLLETIQQVREGGGDERRMLGHLFGQERNLTTAAIARMNLFLHGAEDFQIVRGDTLRQPAFLTSEDTLATFDCVIANPPFSLKAWGEDKWLNDPWGRNFAGTPPKKYGDWAWVEHMVASMAPGTGRMAVVLPHGALFRMGAEGKIRSKVLDADLIEAVIGLGPNLFYGTSLAACIMVARRRKPAERNGKVLLVDASDLFRKGRNQNTLEQEHVETIFDCYRRFEEEGRSHVATLDEIREQDGNLNLAGYVAHSDEIDILTVEEATRALKSALEDTWDAEERLNRLLAKQGIA